MVEQMKAVAPQERNSGFHYLPIDITLMADVKRFAKECIIIFFLVTILLFYYFIFCFTLTNADSALNTEGLNTLCM